MADDTTNTDDTPEQDTAPAGDETSQPGDDLAGLKSALAAEREQRKALEKQARTNAKAAEELEKLRASQMTETEKAVAQAKAEGRTEAVREHGRTLAEAKFEAALARKGLDLGPAAELIDKSRFVGDDGTVDQDAIKKAVDQLAKLTPKTPGTSGGDFGGGNGSGTPAKSLDEQIAEAKKAGDWRLVMRLENSKLANPTQ
jgi:hypothetical protein